MASQMCRLSQKLVQEVLEVGVGGVGAGLTAICIYMRVTPAAEGGRGAGETSGVRISQGERSAGGRSAARVGESGRMRRGEDASIEG